jgi:CxxC motif-containing protein (DUF1111 family)
MTRWSMITGAAWVAALIWALAPVGVGTQPSAEDAPTGFDGQTNGLVDQSTFDEARDVFAEQEEIADGLGPVYNAQSCGECHQNPVTGGISQITELRAGRINLFGEFVDHPGGSLIHSRAIDAAIQELVLAGHGTRTLRTSLGTLGDGFVECIADETLIEIASDQAVMTNGRIEGEVVWVPVTEAGNQLRVGRFGHKNQHASLVSFSADAYLNEMGITSPLQPVENTSNGRSIASFDPTPDPEDDGDDVLTFATFMRATKAPPRDQALAATPEAQLGEQIFDEIGCATCHRSSIMTAPKGTPINGGTLAVPRALGNKVIHPFGDFLLHDVGTGDGIVQNGGPSTRDKVRTAPLWGLRTRNRLMHDGLSLTLSEAIRRHRGEASLATLRFIGLKRHEERALLAFLSSL